MAEIRHSSHLAFDGPILRSIVHVLVEVTELRYVISRYGSDFLKKRGLHLLTGKPRPGQSDNSKTSMYSIP